MIDSTERKSYYTGRLARCKLQRYGGKQIPVANPGTGVFPGDHSRTANRDCGWDFSLARGSACCMSFFQLTRTLELCCRKHRQGPFYLHQDARRSARRRPSSGACNSPLDDAQFSGIGCFRAVWHAAIRAQDGGCRLNRGGHESHGSHGKHSENCLAPWRARRGISSAPTAMWGSGGGDYRKEPDVRN
jgi:hypothetical protein